MPQSLRGKGAARDDLQPLNRFHKANRCSVLLPVFAGFIEMVVAAFGELVRGHDAPDDNDQYYPKNNAWLHDVALAET